MEYQAAAIELQWRLWGPVLVGGSCLTLTTSGCLKHNVVSGKKRAVWLMQHHSVEVAGKQTMVQSSWR